MKCSECKKKIITGYRDQGDKKYKCEKCYFKEDKKDNNEKNI